MSILSSKPLPVKRNRKPVIETAPAERSPLEAGLVRVAWLLGWLGYHPTDIEAAVEHCRRTGSAEDCEVLDVEDRPHVTALLPRNPS